MLTLAILGFLAERPMHAYELRKQISELTGHTRPLSDGALYPAINRLEKAGHIERRTEAPTSGRGPTRQVLTLTATGRAELRRRLSEPAEVEITDGASFFTLLAFLSHLPEPADQARLLQRRLDFLTAPAGFFYSGDTPLRIADVEDRYRRGMLVMARATSRAERQWLTETLAELANGHNNSQEVLNK
ncbi:PadR family transcriptional regulator [Streptomyces sp. NBC_01262]|uniref:PadR family transcriptional regulator n=1 Tax=Streptomyces sp. NBC_01262 TaxID=2903803 RepID=UPI002E36BD9F|nr:PadR family transcriptional regulator [Streptomyces sp. NBC_01262]